MSDGFELEFDENWTMLHQRLMTFADKVANQITVSALKETASLMKEEAILFTNISKGPHLLKVDEEYIEIYPENLRKHIRYRKLYKRDLESGEVGYKVFVAIRTAWYAKFMEFGRSNMAPRPFMRPAFEHNREKLALTFKKMIDELILRGGFE